MNPMEVARRVFLEMGLDHAVRPDVPAVGVYTKAVTRISVESQLSPIVALGLLKRVSDEHRKGEKNDDEAQNHSE